ncbi:beta-glucosidase [Pseudoduganella namucuonensis]|nr:beta-glucosidase [Pseudoduganella namucuonensis]
MKLNKNACATAVALALLGGAGASWAQTPAQTAAQTPASQPWMDRSLPAEQRAALVLKEMTDDEKINLLFGYFPNDFKGIKRQEAGRKQAAGYFKGIPRLGIPELHQADAGIGVASQPGPDVRERTALPSGMATAATWNPALAYQGGAMIGAEARASGFNILLAGGVNLAREPRNGRNFEYGGEDPWLAAQMVGAQIRGIQSNHIVSTIKHFAANDQETGRNHLDARLGDQAARTSDLLAFQFAIENASPGAVMCGYNRYNGDYACENDYLLNQVLKRDWGYKGWVMSDWGGTHSTVPAANRGLDQQSGWPFDHSAYFNEALKEAVENGHVPRARFDDMAKRVLWALFDKGVIDHPVAEGGAIDYAAHAKVSQADAEEGIVLLKNSKQLLPLAPGLKSIAIIGSHANVGVLSGGGSSQVYPAGGMAVPGLGPKEFPGPMVYFPSSPMKSIAARSKAQLRYADGSDVAAAAQLAASSELVIVFANQWTAEALDASLTLPDRQDALIAAVAKANPNTVVVLESGGPVLMPWLDQVGAVVEAWYPGTAGGEAIARVLSGEVDASGRLPLTFPASLEQLPRPKLDGEGLPKDSRFTVNYHEGAAVGYKWFDLKGHKPLFPFGHGLSYGSVAYSGLAARADGGKLTVTFKVSNDGQRTVKDVPQVYVSPANAAKWEAPKRLAAFEKVELKPGESRTVSLSVDPRLLAVFDTADKRWKIGAGDYRVQLAKSAADIRHTVSVRLPARSLDVRGK